MKLQKKKRNGRKQRKFKKSGTSERKRRRGAERRVNKGRDTQIEREMYFFREEWRVEM